MIQNESEATVPETKPAKRGRQQKPSDIIDYFVACPRCSYFLAGYRLLQPDLDQAIEESAGDWLSLTWDHQVRNLVYKSFGYEMGEELQALQGVCPDCQRAFVYQSPSEEGDASQFSVQINPRS